MPGVKRWGPIILLACALAAAAALLLSLDSHLTFVGDGWDLLARRQDWSLATFLAPFHEQLVLAPTLIYRLLAALFGINSALPFYVVSVSLFLLSATLLFVYVRSRLGDWPALIAALLVLFLGAASEDLLWEFQMGFFGSAAAGIGALLALNREDRWGDRIGSGLLLLSLAFSSLGIAFVAAGAVHVALGRRPLPNRVYVFLLPAAAYGLWLLGWGDTAGSSMSFENLVHLPGYVFDAAAAGIASLLGQAPVEASGHPPILCRIALVVLLVAGAFRIVRQGHCSPRLAVVVALALTFWILTGVGRNPDRYATSSRYQYPSAIFILLIATEMLHGLRISKLALGAMTVVTAAAIFGGISLLHRDYTHIWKPMADEVRLTLAAYDIAGESVRPGERILFPPSTQVSARSYLEAVDRSGSPAFTEADLASRDGSERQRVDIRLAEVLDLRLAPLSSGAQDLRCRVLGKGRAAPSPAPLPPGTYTLKNLGNKSNTLRLGRFSKGFPIKLGHLPSEAERSLVIPSDTSPRPWRLISLGDSTRLC
jgi:hypothetical protein